MDGFAIERAHLGNFADDATVEIGVYAQTVIKIFGAIENVMKLLVKLRNGKRLISAKLALRPFNSRAPPYPDLLFRIAWSNKEGVLLLSPGCYDGDGFGFFEARQVVKIRILAETILSVVGTRGFMCRGKCFLRLGAAIVPERNGTEETSKGTSQTLIFFRGYILIYESLHAHL